eukprot:2712363-Prymnesium_polylepis.1
MSCDDQPNNPIPPTRNPSRGQRSSTHLDATNRNRRNITACDTPTPQPPPSTAQSGGHHAHAFANGARSRGMQERTGGRRTLPNPASVNHPQKASPRAAPCVSRSMVPPS